MGVYVYLEIIPEKIGKKEWEKLYLETLSLLTKCSDEMMGIQREKIRNVERTIYSRQIEQHAETPAKRQWHVVGDFSSKQTGESFIFFRDIQRYRSSSSIARKKAESSEDDILASHINESRLIRDVFNSKTQGHLYHTPMLAVAMVVENRFPNYALAGGNIDIHQAKKAQQLISDVLHKPISLPIRVDSERLFTRLNELYSDIEAIEHFYDLFLGERNESIEVLFKLANPELYRQWFTTHLAHYKSPDQFGAKDIFIAWLNTSGDLKTLCEIACLDDQGPRFNPIELSSSLASTWFTIHPSERRIMDIFANPEGHPETVDSQFGMMFLDMLGLKGRNIRMYMEQEKALGILEQVFPEYQKEIREKVDRITDDIRKTLSEHQEPINILKEKAERNEPPGLGDGTQFLTMTSVNDASEQEIFMLRFIAYRINKIREKYLEAYPKTTEASLETLMDMMITVSDSQGIVLTEDAWKWIDQESDPELVMMTFMLISIKDNELVFSNARKGILENRDVCKSLLEIMKNEDLMEIIEQAIQFASKEKNSL